MKYFLFSTLFIASVVSAHADECGITALRHVGPYAITAPVMLDSTNAQGQKLDTVALVAKSRLNPSLLKSQGVLYTDSIVPGVPADSSQFALNALGFTLQNRSYVQGLTLDVKGLKNHTVYVDDKPASGTLTLTPGTHPVVIQYMAQGGKADTLRVSLKGDSLALAKVSQVSQEQEGKGLYTIERMLDSYLYSSGMSLSPSGKYLFATTTRAVPGNREYHSRLMDRATGRILRYNTNGTWMPSTDRYYYTRNNQNNRKKELIIVDAATGAETLVANDIPEGYFFFTPDEQKLIYYVSQEGAKEKEEIFEIIHPDDRQPGWRNRSYLAIYDLQTGVMQPLTHNYNNVSAQDISADSRHLLFSKNEACLQSRPTTTSTLLQLDLQTLAVDTLVLRDGFISSAKYSPDGRQVLISGTAEAFGRIGCTLPDSVIPNYYDAQFFLLDIASREVKPLTRNFNPSVQSYEWSKADGMIYFTAEHRDSLCLYRYNPKSEVFTRLNVPEDIVTQFSLAEKAPVLACVGESVCNSNRLYQADLTKVKDPAKARFTCIEDLSADNLAGIQLAECKPWTFVNSIGDTVLCRYYLPVGLDETQAIEALQQKTYPMIVYYYGGCSPSSRYLEYTYPQQCWAAMGYGALVVEPSGASGFGQEWGARHVNTAGVDPARDIIEATQQFCKEHAWVNEKKIGCIGASYGGFMTQYLQTVTDIFAAAVSHAGISDHTNYWGYGYWGYTYSEISMADSYPWSRKDLYVDRSPLYNVDKIHTPILFLHGTEDTNVPWNNSLQMYTALRLLDREVAFVSVKGENHGIRDYNKRILWHNTTMAWFAKWLQDDDSWWEALYPKKAL